VNYIFPALALAITIGLFVVYATMRQNFGRSGAADEIPNWPDSSHR